MFGVGLNIIYFNVTKINGRWFVERILEPGLVNILQCKPCRHDPLDEIFALVWQDPPTEEKHPSKSKEEQAFFVAINVQFPAQVFQLMSAKLD